MTYLHSLQEYQRVQNISTTSLLEVELNFYVKVTVTLIVPMDLYRKSFNICDFSLVSLSISMISLWNVFRDVLVIYCKC